jgi:hypothetical protein
VEVWQILRLQVLLGIMFLISQVNWSWCLELITNQLGRFKKVYIQVDKVDVLIGVVDVGGQGHKLQKG